MNILIVEDEEHLAVGLKFNLEAEGYETVIAGDGETGLELLKAGAFDAVVLDVMLPGIDGFGVAAAMRERADYTPILMLTARGRPEDVLNGFQAGADDYLPKPFDLEIFLARLNGLLRRREWLKNESAPAELETLHINGREIDLINLELRHGSEIVRLTLMEVNLLRYLIANEGRPVSRKAILEDVWNLQEDTDTRAIDRDFFARETHEKTRNMSILFSVFSRI
jgi:DNA-binding response OmpR family regulator